MTDEPTTLDTPEHWDAASRGYADKVAPLMMRPFADPLIERLNVDGNADVLEVGAGSGVLTEVLVPRVKSLLATDFAPGMLDILRERMEAACAANVQCQVMDGQALNVEDSSFDAAVSSFALMLFPDRLKGFSELCRVVRPNGRVAVTAWTGPDRFEAFGLFLAAVNAAFPDMPAPPSPPPVFSLADPERFKSEMESAGFRDVEIELVGRSLEIPDVDTMWGVLTSGAPPVQALLDRIGPSGQERLHDKLREIVDERFGDGPIKVTNVATLGSGTAT